MLLQNDETFTQITFIQKIPESSGYPIKLVGNVRNPQFLQAGAPVRER